MNLKKAIKLFKKINKTDYLFLLGINLLLAIFSIGSLSDLPQLFIENGYNENPEFALTFFSIGVFACFIIFIFIYFVMNTIKLVIKEIKSIKGSEKNAD